MQSKLTLLKSKFFPAKIPFSKIQKKNLAGKKLLFKRVSLLCKNTQSNKKMRPIHLASASPLRSKTNCLQRNPLYFHSFSCFSIFFVYMKHWDTKSNKVFFLLISLEYITCQASKKVIIYFNLLRICKQFFFGLNYNWSVYFSWEIERLLKLVLEIDRFGAVSHSVWRPVSRPHPLNIKIKKHEYHHITDGSPTKLETKKIQKKLQVLTTVSTWLMDNKSLK